MMGLGGVTGMVRSPGSVLCSGTRLPCRPTVPGMSAVPPACSAREGASLCRRGRSTPACGLPANPCAHYFWRSAHTLLHVCCFVSLMRTVLGRTRAGPRGRHGCPRCHAPRVRQPADEARHDAQHDGARHHQPAGKQRPHPPACHPQTTATSPGADGVGVVQPHTYKTYGGIRGRPAGRHAHVCGIHAGAGMALLVLHSACLPA